VLVCCGLQFFAAEKIILPQKDMLYRCLEYGFCPNCGTKVARLIEQDYSYEIFIKESRGIKALRQFEKALKQREKMKSVRQGSKIAENYYYGDFRKTRKKDSNNQPIYLQIRKNFNNKSEILGEIVTHYSKI